MCRGVIVRFRSQGGQHVLVANIMTFVGCRTRIFLGVLFAALGPVLSAAGPVSERVPFGYSPPVLVYCARAGARSLPPATCSLVSAPGRSRTLGHCSLGVITFFTSPPTNLKWPRVRVPFGFVRGRLKWPRGTRAVPLRERARIRRRRRLAERSGARVASAAPRPHVERGL